MSSEERGVEQTYKPAISIAVGANHDNFDQETGIPLVCCQLYRC
jgi:hypothetical protein